MNIFFILIFLMYFEHNHIYKLNIYYILLKRLFGITVNKVLGVLLILVLNGNFYEKSLFLLLPLVVTNAHAVYVDVRHEYLDDSKANYDRAYISHRFANGFGFAIEAISKSGGDDTDRPFNDLEVQGNEYTVSYQSKQERLPGSRDLCWKQVMVIQTINLTSEQHGR